MQKNVSDASEATQSFRFPAVSSPFPNLSYASMTPVFEVSDALHCLQTQCINNLYEKHQSGISSYQMDPHWNGMHHFDACPAPTQWVASSSEKRGPIEPMASHPRSDIHSGADISSAFLARQMDSKSKVFEPSF